MAILNKIKASSLLETLTASVIIMIVFMIASFSFSNIFTNLMKNEKYLLDNRLLELEYLILNNQVDSPYTERGKYWLITGREIGSEYIINVHNLRSGKQLKKKYYKK